MPRVVITRRVIVSHSYPQSYEVVRQRRGPNPRFHALMTRLVAIGVALLIIVPIVHHIASH